MLEIFWIEKPRVGIKKILLLLTLLTTAIILKNFYFLLLNTIFIVILIVCAYKYGYNILIDKFSINQQTYRIIDFIQPSKKDHFRKMLKNGDTVSVININNPKSCEYMPTIETLIDFTKNKNDILHLGGAGCSIPIFISHHSKTTNQTVLEIEPKMIEIAKYFFLPFAKNSAIKIKNTDAIKFIHTTKIKYDYIIQDLLMKKGRESDFFLQKSWINKVEKKLKKGGTLIINTSTKSPETAINVMFSLRNFNNKQISIKNLEKTYILIIKNE